MNLKNISPKIYAGVAILGVGVTSYLTAKGALTAEKRIQEKGAVTKKEKFRAAFPCYIPALASACITSATIIGGFNELIRKNTQLAMAYGFGQTMIRLYSERTPVEIRKQVAEEVMQMPEIIELDTTSGPEDMVIKFTDYLSDREFHASRKQVKNSIDEFTETVLKTNGRGSLNQLYLCFHNPDELGPIGYTGDVLGWEYVNDQGPIPLISPGFDKYGLPCTILDYVNPPKDGYDNNFA